jgi:3-phosphoshikimate 1-carboxyvinyltransferase
MFREATIPLNVNQSSQFITATLIGSIVSPCVLDHKVLIHFFGSVVSSPYVEMSLRLMEMLGCPIERYGWSRLCVVKPVNAYHTTFTFHVESDLTSVSYLVVLGSFSLGFVKVYGVNLFSIQGDIFFISVLRRYGVKVIPFMTGLVVFGSRVCCLPFLVNGLLIPDVAMTVMVLMVFVKAVVSNLFNILTWRFKETDRVLAMALEMRKLNVLAECGVDFIKIRTLKPLEQLNERVYVSTYRDHRIAMCFSIFETVGFNLHMLGGQCVNKTFPDYFYVLNWLGAK